MAKKVLGRDLADLLTRARPARLVERAGARVGAGSGSGAPGAETAAEPSATPLDLPLESPSESAAPAAVPVGSPEAPVLPGLVPGATGGHSIHRTASSPVFASRPMAPTVPPAETGSRGWFYGLLVVDGVLLALAAVLYATDIVDPPWGHRLAAVAVVLGAGCAILAYLLRPGPPPPPPASRVRVQLRRI